MKSRSPSRPGFTLLEVILAATIGSIVALVAIGLMTTLDRADTKLTARYREITQLERAHTIMSRAFSSILVAERSNVRVNRSRNAAAASGTPSAPAGSTGGGTTPSATPGAAGRIASPAPDGAGSSSFSSAKDSGQRPKLDQPARIALSSDASLGGLGMGRPSSARLEVGNVQRLEIVLAATPVPRPATARSRARAAAAIESSMFDENDAGQSAMPESTGQAIRGVFELRPTTVEGRPMFASDGSVRSWTLWWRPLPRLVQDSDGTVRTVGLAPGDPIEVATDLSYCRWQVFDDRQRKSEYAAAYFTDLPAYVEMEVATTSGLWANWMFEVDWATGSESAGTSGDEESEEDEAAANGTGAENTPPGNNAGRDK